MLKKVFRREAYYIASVTFMVLGLIYFIVTINRPYIGLNIEDVNGQWFVTIVDPYGEGYHAGVKIGDEVLKVNEDVPSNYPIIQKWSQVEGASTIEFRRQDQPTYNLIKLHISTDWHRNLEEVPLHILGFVFWLLGFMTWFKRPFLAQSRAIFWVNWIIGMTIVFASASSRCMLFGRELEYISLSLLPIFLINLVSVFPKENKNRVTRFSHIMFVIISIIIIIVTILQSGGVIKNVSSLLGKLVILTVIVALLLALGNLGSLIKLPKDYPERNQAGILLLGMVIGFFPFVFLTAVPQLFNLQPISYNFFSSLFLSAVPIAWYYVIVNKYLPDSRRLFNIIISFFGAGVFISFLVTYVLIFFKAVKTFSLEVYLAALFFTILFMVCSSFMRAVISKILDKIAFFTENQGFKRRVLKLNESLTSINEEGRILEEIVKSLSIEGAFIVVEDGKGGYHKKAQGIFLEKPNQQIEMEEFFHADLRVNLEAEILPENFPAEIYIPVVSEDFSCGIFIGHRYSHVKFEQDEIPLITLISSQLAQRLITTFVIKELSKEIAFLAQRSQDSQRRNQGLQGITSSLVRSLEKERKSIAWDIHNGPLQLGLDLNRWLKYLIEECPTDNKVVKAISHMRELVENLNFELRLISNDLRPSSLTDLGLFTAVELMCEEIMLKELSIISLETVGFNREDRFKEEVELAAYRFLQEGITNAVKHSGSNKIKLFIEMTESNLELTVRDSGKGFDTSKIDAWSLTSERFGIVGMKERIESLGGNLKITSEIHRGTMLKAAVPII